MGWLQRWFGIGEVEDKEKDREERNSSNATTRPRTEVKAPSSSTYRVLQSTGWSQPERKAQNVRAGVERLDMGNARRLQGYSYNYTPEEWELARGAYSGAEGYTPGSNVSPQSLKPIDTNIELAASISDEEYEKLTTAQKRAVDFNTMLVNAREKDLTEAGDPENRAEYDKQVADIFGEGGGSERYAPNTVRLLESIGFTAKGQDLDEYLSLERAITSDELEGFAYSNKDIVELELTEDMPQEYATAVPDTAAASRYGPGTPRGSNRSTTGAGAASRYGIGPLADENAPDNMERVLQQSNFAEVRSAENMRAVDTAAIQKAGEFIDLAMKNVNAWDFDSAIELALTGQTTGSPFNLEDPTLSEEEQTMKDNFYQSAWDAVRDPEQDISVLWEQMDLVGYEDKDVQDLMYWLDQMTVRQIELGQVDPTLRDPGEIRDLLGMEPIAAAEEE